VEGSLSNIHKAMTGLMHAKGLMETPVRMEEIQHFLETKKTRIKIDIDDIVEIIGGPFKGERGRIKRIDSVKDEVTIELLEAAIPIPVTIATEFIKVVKKANPESVSEKETAKADEKESEKSIFDDIKEDSGEKMNDEKHGEAGAESEAGEGKI
jgi:ribosomal protein L24